MLCHKNKFFCDSCCDLQEAEKRYVSIFASLLWAWKNRVINENTPRMKIKKLPNVLALHLKRFKYQEDLGKYIKLTYRVAFPFELRLFNTVDGMDDTYGNDTIMDADNSGNGAGSGSSYSGSGNNNSQNTGAGLSGSAGSGSTSGSGGAASGTSGSTGTTGNTSKANNNTYDPNNDPVENSNYYRNKKAGSVDSGGSAGNGQGTGTGTTGNNSRVSDPRDQKS